METIKEILDGVKERLSSPLFGAFAVAWAICNWDILICLWKFDVNMLNNCGWSSYTECVSEQVGVWKSYVIPFVSALIYIFLYPIFKAWLSVQYAKITKHYGNIEIQHRMGSFVSVDNMVKMQEEIEKQKMQLAERIEKNEVNFLRAAALQTELGQKEVELSDMKETLKMTEIAMTKATGELEVNNREGERILEISLNKDNELKQLKSQLSVLEDKNKNLTHKYLNTILMPKTVMDALGGSWKSEFKFPNGKSGKNEFRLSGADCYRIIDNVSVKVATFKHFIWEKLDDKRILIFTKVLEQPDTMNRVVNEHHRGKYLVNELEAEFDDEKKKIVRMWGVEDGQIEIKYTRIEESTTVL